LLVEQLPLRLGIAAAQLDPIEQTGARHCPILIIAGSADRHTPLVETQAYFRGNAVSQGVVDPSTGRPMSTCMPAPAAYETKVAEFLRKYLRPPA